MGYPVTARWFDGQDLMSHQPQAEQICQTWLLNIESLTERLTQCCDRFSVAVLSQTDDYVVADEAALIQVEQDQRQTIREVLLKGDDTSWVFARSVFPSALNEQEFNDLGNRPLGKLLFDDPRFVRQPFSVALMPIAHPFVVSLLDAGMLDIQQLTQHCHIHHGVWARRSVFTYLTHHILVTEVFLPGAPAYA